MTTLRNIGFSLLAAAALALPASAKAKAKADVTCSDGTTSKAGRGACSHHGGVAHASAPAAKAEKSASAKTNERPDTPARADEKKPEEKSSGGILGGLFGKRSDSAQGRSSSASPRSSTRDAKSGTPTARCKDGTTSYSAHRSGTCSNHGGVAEWLSK
jgi:hypothetical protein